MIRRAPHPTEGLGGRTRRCEAHVTQTVPAPPPDDSAMRAAASPATGASDGVDGGGGTPSDAEATAQAARSMDARGWREQLRPYAAPDSRRAALCLATSVVPYLALSAAIYLLLGQSLLALLLGVPAAIFLVRSFIVFHDCSHGSFFASRRANAWLGPLDRAAPVLAVPPLAPRPCRSPRDRGEPRPSRNR